MDGGDFNDLLVYGRQHLKNGGTFIHNPERVEIMDWVKKSHRRLLIALVLFTTPLFIYAAIFEILLRQSPEGIGGFEKTMGFLPYVILLGIAALCLLLSVPLRRFLLNYRLSASSFMLIWKDMPAPVLRSFYAASVLFGLFHTTGVIGFMLSFFTGNRIFVYLGMALALILNAACFPRYHRWEEWIREAEAVENHPR